MTPRRLIEPARLAGAAVLRTQSDTRLIDLVREGNEPAFEAIVHRYRRPLLRYCGRVLSPARAEDAVQQAFVNAYAALRRDDAEVNLRPWLYRIAHNSALNVLRAAGDDLVQVDESIDGVETPPQALERGERFRSVVAAVQDLPERQRDAIVLQALEGLSYEEIALQLGVTGGAVRQLLNRARTTLREAATALTPAGIATRAAGHFDAPVADRVAQVVAGTGGGAALAKGVAVLAMAGAAVGGAAEGILPGGGGRATHRAPVATSTANSVRQNSRAETARAAASPREGRGAGVHGHPRGGARAPERQPGRGGSRHPQHEESRQPHRHTDDRGGSRNEQRGTGRGEGHSGPGSGESDDDVALVDRSADSGSGSSGSDGSGSGSSGSGGGDSSTDSGSSGSGESSSDGGGSGSSGSGSGELLSGSSGSGDGLSGGGTSGESH